MKIHQKGYTLIELIVAVSLLIIVLVGGTAIFYRSFRSSGVSDIQSSLNSGLRMIDEMIEWSLRYGEVVRVDDNLRINCLAGGEDGVTGSTLVVRSPSGAVITYSLDNGKVASDSATISNQNMSIGKLEFTWFCKSGVNDKINLYIEASPTPQSGEVSKNIFNKDINLLNSGIN